MFRKPTSGKLLAGKKVWAHSTNKAGVEAWMPMLSFMGAEVVLDDAVPQNKTDMVHWIRSGKTKSRTLSESTLAMRT